MYEVFTPKHFKNPTDYEICKKRFKEELPNNVIEYGCEERFDVDIEDTCGDVCIAEEIIGEFEYSAYGCVSD